MQRFLRLIQRQALLALLIAQILKVKIAIALRSWQTMVLMHQLSKR